jgi:glycosyltransferase involved in cell wall biosynthesis
MNILFLSSNYPYPPVDGHGLRTYNILKILAEKNKVFFVGFSKEPVCSPDPVQEMCASVTVVKPPGAAGRARTYLSFLMNTFLSHPFIIEKYSCREFRGAVRDAIAKYRIDLVHFDILHLTGYAGDAGELCKVLTQHNVESERLLTLLRNSGNPVLKFFLYLEYRKIVRYEKNICSKFDACICVSTKDLHNMKKMSSVGEFVEIANGVDADFFEPKCPDGGDDSLIWVGNMADIYNGEAVDFFCKRIYPELELQFPGAKCTFIGNSPTGALTKLAALRSNIDILGFVDDVRPHLSRARAFIAPVRSGGGTKLKVLVAMSMGLPVITTSTGAEGIEVEHGRNILIADDPRDFAHYAAELLKNPQTALAMGGEARKLVLEKYDWKVLARKQLELYDTLVAGGNAPVGPAGRSLEN